MLDGEKPKDYLLRQENADGEGVNGEYRNRDQHKSKPRRGDVIPAQGEALGYRAIEIRALKGRPIGGSTIDRPFRAQQL